MKARLQVPERRPGKFRFDFGQRERNRAVGSGERCVFKDDCRPDEVKAAVDFFGFNNDAESFGKEGFKRVTVIVELRRDEPARAQDDKAGNKIEDDEDRPDPVKAGVGLPGTPALRENSP